MPLSTAQVWRGIGNLVFPPRCVHCHGLVAVDQPDAGHLQHLCAGCAAQLIPVQAPYCPTCGHPFHGIVEGERICPHCEGLEPEFARGVTAVLFKGPARSLVIELKYHRGVHVVADIEEIFRRTPHVRELAAGAVLVPVPLHPRKARERGYNQAELLAAALARAAGGGARVAPILARVVDTPTQTALDRRTRRSNLKNAFALARGADLNPALHFILVDDVFTTGSTLNSCARVLRRAGGLNVDVVTFGHG